MTTAPVGGSRPASSASRVDLPQPDGPRSTVTPVPGSTASRCASAGTGPAVVRDADVGEHQVGAGRARWRRRRLGGVRRERVDGLERRHPLGGGVELRADPAQRPVGLGGEQQHDQPGAQVEVAVGEPDARR